MVAVNPFVPPVVRMLIALFLMALLLSERGFTGINPNTVCESANIPRPLPLLSLFVMALPTLSKLTATPIDRECL